MKKILIFILILLWISQTFWFTLTVNAHNPSWLNRNTEIGWWNGGWRSVSSLITYNNVGNSLYLVGGKYNLTKSWTGQAKMYGIEEKANSLYALRSLPIGWMIYFWKPNTINVLDTIKNREITIPYNNPEWIKYPRYWNMESIQTYKGKDKMRINILSYGTLKMIIEYNMQNNKYRTITAPQDGYWNLATNGEYIATMKWSKICWRKSNIWVSGAGYNFSCFNVYYPGWITTKSWYRNIVHMFWFIGNNYVFFERQYTDTALKNKNIMFVFNLKTGEEYYTNWVWMSYFWVIKYPTLAKIDKSGIHTISPNVDYIQQDRNIACTRTQATKTINKYNCTTIGKAYTSRAWDGNRNLWTPTTVNITLSTKDWTATEYKPNVGRTFTFTIAGTVPKLIPPPPTAPTGWTHFWEIAKKIIDNIPTIKANIIGRTVYLYSNSTWNTTNICTKALQKCTNSTIQTIALQNCIQNLNEKTPITCNIYNQIYGNCWFQKCWQIWNSVYTSHNQTIIGTQTNWIIINNPKTQPVCNIADVWIWTCSIPKIWTWTFDALWYVPAVFGYTFCEIWQTVHNTINFWQDIMRILGAILVYQPWWESQLQNVGFQLNVAQNKHWISMQFQTWSSTQLNQVWIKVMDVKDWILGGLDAIMAIILILFVFNYLFRK